jgi:hypothetical protein
MTDVFAADKILGLAVHHTGISSAISPRITVMLYAPAQLHVHIS